VKSPKQLIQSIGDAFYGFFTALKSETSLKIQFTLGIIAIGLGFYFKISTTEWMFVVLSISAVLTTETINSSIEELADRVTLEKDPMVKKVKDMAAGAVLITAIANKIICFLIFITKFIK
jgi:diacylglycerol kinase